MSMTKQKRMKATKENKLKYPNNTPGTICKHCGCYDPRYHYRRDSDRAVFGSGASAPPFECPSCHKQMV